MFDLGIGLVFFDRSTDESLLTLGSAGGRIFCHGDAGLFFLSLAGVRDGEGKADSDFS